LNLGVQSQSGLSAHAAYPAIIYGHIIIKSKLGITIDRASSIKIYVDSLAALAPTILILYITNLLPIIELALGALVYLASYLIMLKVTHTLNEDDYQIFHSLLSTTGPLSKPRASLDGGSHIHSVVYCRYAYS